MVINLKDIKTYCPQCEEEITLPGSEILKAARFKSKSGGKALVGCPKCFYVMLLPSGMPEDLAEVEKWIGTVDERTFACVPFLDSGTARIPNGTVIDAGTVKYRTGDGNMLLSRRDYMFQYGIDPELYYKANPSVGGKPTKVGK